MATGIILTGHGVNALLNETDSRASTWVWALIALLSGASVLLGFLTPIGSLLAVVFSARIALSWLPQLPNLIQPGPVAALVGIVAAALAFLGPGAFSMDSRLFGRREIIIPQISRSPKS